MRECFDFRRVRLLPAMEETQVDLFVLAVRTTDTLPRVSNELFDVIGTMNKPIAILRKSVPASFETQWPHREIP